MKSVSDLEPQLLKILTNFSDWFFNSGYENNLKPFEKKEDIDSGLYATSEEYLRKALKYPLIKYGYPMHMYGAVMENVVPYDRLAPEEYRYKCQELDNELINYFGARNNALRAYYPPGGYIGWHHNGNAHGHNILLTCNPEGDGEFLQYDLNNDEIITHPDNKGWSAKVGYFGNVKEPEKIYWHCARTRTPRITISYVIPNAYMWEQMVDDLHQ